MKIDRVRIEKSDEKYTTKLTDRFYFGLIPGTELFQVNIRDGIEKDTEGYLKADRDILQDAIDAGILNKKHRSRGIEITELTRIYNNIEYF